MDAVPEIGRTFSHYRLIEKIGEGGMGVVWKAEDTLLGRTVAVKLLPADLSRDERRRKMFLDEARLASSVSEAHIVQVFDFGREGDLDFIVMEYIEGKPLSKVLKARTLTPERVAEIGHQVARALSRAHKKGLLHRDLKPSNILITPEGDAKVVDFGLAALFTPQETSFAAGSMMTEAETLTATSHPEERGIAGTLPYMSPEQVKGEELDARSDIFSLGVVLYEMTTGHRPFTGPTWADVAKRIQDARPKPVHELFPDVPLDLERHIHKALAPHRGDRYQTMDDLAVDLKRLSRDLESGSSPSYASTVIGVRRGAVRWWMAVGATVLVVAIVVGAGIYLWPRFSSQPEKASPQATSTLERNRVVVAIFENQTGDTSLDPLGKMAADWITEGLTRLGSVEVVPTSLVFDLVRSPSSPATRPKDPLIALAEATGAGLVVSGAYYLQGQTLQVQARITDAVENRLLYAVEPANGPRDRAMEAVEVVRKRVVEAVAAGQGTTMELLTQERKPPKYEAYQEFVRAEEVAGVVDLPEMTGHLNRALELDPEFVAPRFRLMAHYLSTGNGAEAAKQLEIVEKIGEQLTPVQRRLVDYFKASLAGRQEGALNAARELVRLAPGDVWNNYLLAIDEYMTNHPKRAIEVLDKPVRWELMVNPGRKGGWGYFDILLASLHQLGEYERELVEARKCRKIYPEIVFPQVREAGALIALGRIDEAEKVIQESLGTSFQWGTSGVLLYVSAQELRSHGRREDSLKMAGRAYQWASDHQEKLPASLYLAARWEEARAAFEARAKEQPDELRFRGFLGSLAARRGDRAEATRISEELRKIERPYLYGENIYQRARIAAQLGQKDEAVSLLREAISQGWSGPLVDGTLSYAKACHREMDFEPLIGYPPYEELIKTKD